MPYDFQPNRPNIDDLFPIPKRNDKRQLFGVHISGEPEFDQGVMDIDIETMKLINDSCTYEPLPDDVVPVYFKPDLKFVTVEEIKAERRRRWAKHIFMAASRASASLMGPYFR